MNVETKLIGAFALLIVGTKFLWAQDVNQDLLTQEKKVWAASTVPNADPNEFMSFLAPDYLQIDPMGSVANREEALKSLAVCHLTEAKISNEAVRTLSPSSAVVVYRIKVLGTCAGQPVPPLIECGDTWVRREGKWLIQLHTEVVVAPQR